MAPAPHLFAFYGTLMSGQRPRPGRPTQLDAHMTALGPCRIPGKLLDTGHGYPALVADERPAGPWPDLVCGELCQVTSDRGVELLDRWEGREFLRVELRLAHPQMKASVYTWAGEAEGFEEVVSGCWRTHSWGQSLVKCDEAAHPLTNEL